MSSQALTAVLSRIQRRSLTVTGRKIYPPCLLFGIAQEIRDMIYDLVLTSDGWIGLNSQVNFTTKRLLPGYGLLSTNWQIHRECIRIIYKHEILVVSVSRHFELQDLRLTIPKTLIINVRFLTLHISAPEIKSEQRMLKLRKQLRKAHNLESLTLEIWPNKTSKAGRTALVGWTGKHVLRKGLSSLQGVKVRGKVTIRLVGNHEYGPNPRTAEKFEKSCQKMLNEIAETMMSDG